MARELGMNPAKLGKLGKLGKLDNHDQEPASLDRPTIAGESSEINSGAREPGLAGVGPPTPAGARRLTDLRPGG